MTLYEGCKTTVSIDGELSSSFSVKLVVHQGSALSPFFYHGNGCSDRCEGWFINGAAACDLFLCEKLLNEVMGKYGRRKKMQWKERVRVNVDKKGICSYYLGRKVVFRRWILVVRVVGWLVLLLMSVRNVRGGFIVVLMCLGR